MGLIEGGRATARVMEIRTPLGGDTLLFLSMNAAESLGRPFEYDIALLSKQSDIDPDKLLGKNVTVKLELANGGPRCFDGYVTRFGLVGMQGRYYRYHAMVRPWLWFLTRTTDCRIFQNKKAPEIIKEIFDKYAIAAFESKLTADYPVREYQVQYRETDFHFVSRLMEQEGIYYYFKHTDGKHTLVLADSASAHEPYPNYETVPFIPHERGVRLDEEYVSQWQFTREIQPGRYVMDDFDFEKPSAELQVQTKQSRKCAESDHEYYDYPGEFCTTGDGDHYVRARLEELHVQYELAQGASNARGLCCGSRFKLTGQGRQDQNREYLIVDATHRFEYNEYEATGAEGANYTCSFTALEAKSPFRPQRTTSKSLVQGPQTAIVVGPAGDEIYTDKYGRVKVQFHWDRYGKSDENSSCWVRVSHPWAGKNWGMVTIPRIGQEVVVDFLEGDPDRPIITGRVYNAEQMPPYDLPANKTQSGAKSRSSMTGDAANFNEIRFEDKKGAEQLFIHAEKNQDIEVENDETHAVGNDRTKTIDNDETTTVKHDRTETVLNNETIAIGVDRTETVGMNEMVTVGSNRSISVGGSETKTVALQRTHAVGVNETIAVGGAQEVAIGGFQAVAIGAYQTVNVGLRQDVNVGGSQNISVGSNQSESVDGNASKNVKRNDALDVDGNRSTNVKGEDALKVGKTLVIDAEDSVTIKTGDASITMKKDGTIVIKGKDITVQGSGKINAKASSDVVIKGSKVGIN